MDANMMPEPAHLFCFGLGQSAATLGRLLLASGWTVSGCVRDADKCALRRREGFDCVTFDGDGVPSSHFMARLGEATHLLLSAPPDEGGDPFLRNCGEALARNEGLDWIGYFSTVGVYGDHGGAWVDEDTLPAPTTQRARYRLIAERQWMDWAAEAKKPLAVLRLAGIYGPDSNPLVRLRSGRAKRVVKPGQVFNRIHVVDIARVTAAAMLCQTAVGVTARARIYNVCDDEPAPPQVVISFAAALLGVEPPPDIPFEHAVLSPMARSFYSDNKRCRNDRIKSELGVTLACPTYREGLAALLHEKKAHG